MKKVLFAIVLLISAISTQAQSDSTEIKGLQLTARLIYFLQPALRKVDNDSLFQVAIDLKKRLVADPIGNTLVTIDSIPTVELANLYNYVLEQPAGLGAANAMRTQLVNIRAANSYLNALCTQYETYMTDKMNSSVSMGRKMAINKNNKN